MKFEIQRHGSRGITPGSVSKIFTFRPDGKLQLLLTQEAGKFSALTSWGSVNTGWKYGTGKNSAGQEPSQRSFASVWHFGQWRCRSPSSAGPTLRPMPAQGPVGRPRLRAVPRTSPGLTDVPPGTQLHAAAQYLRALTSAASQPPCADASPPEPQRVVSGRPSRSSGEGVFDRCFGAI